MERSSFGFSIDVSSDGAARLRKAIKHKLSQFMGAYTDDVLAAAEYVVVLVCHGKHQDQAKKDLDAFLGEHSSAFVAWLWDHIASNMQDYATSSQPSLAVDINNQAKNHHEDGVKKGSEKLNMSIVAESKSKNDDEEPVSIVTHKEVERPIKPPGMLRRRTWTPVNNSSMETKEPPRQHTEYEERNDSSGGQYSHSRAKSGSKRRRSLERWTRRGQFLHDESHADKRAGSPTGIHAPRRILQSAVREAVGPIGSTNSKQLEQSKKRLRSVVSANVDLISTDNLNRLSDAVEASNRPRSFAKTLPAMAVAVKAAAAAAEDVAKFKSIGSVFERLGNRFDSNLNGLHETTEEHMLDDEGNCKENKTEAVYRGHKYQHRSEIYNRSNRGLIDDAEMMDGESIMRSDPLSEDYDEAQEDARYIHHYGGASTRRKQLENRESEVSRISTSKDRQSVQVQKPDKHPEESVIVQYRVAQKSQEMSRENRVQNPSSKTPSASREIVNISVNVNTWKPSHFQTARDAVAMKTKSSNMDSNLLQDHDEMHIDGTFPDVTDTGLRGEAGQIIPATDPNSASNADNCGDTRKGTSASGVCSSVRTPDEADSRTVFVSNVHFAATKEALSKHFARCGEVIKVIIQTDAGNSQPKGSAYIEFASKEMAEMALTWDETSFMSRMLKVTRKSASNIENSILPRTPIRRPLPFLAIRSTRAIYPRGFTSAYRRGGYMSRPFGSRSLQWRRDKASGASDNSVGLGNESPAATSSVPLIGGNPAGPTSSQLPRPLTYIRNAVKMSNENVSQVQE